MSAVLEDHPAEAWQEWLQECEDADWTMADMSETTKAGAGAEIAILYALWEQSGRDAVIIRAAIDSLAELVGEWDAMMMGRHFQLRRPVEFQNFADFGYQCWKENLEGVVPDDLLVKDKGGKVDYNAIGEYYLTSADHVQEGTDGRVFFFTRPGAHDRVAVERLRPLPGV